MHEAFFPHTTPTAKKGATLYTHTIQYNAPTAVSRLIADGAGATQNHERSQMHAKWYKLHLLRSTLMQLLVEKQ